jgi:uncharacterized protein (TIGR04255 family)
VPLDKLDADREIYPRAPLKLVAFEIQYSAMPRLEGEQWEQVYEQLREELPILGARPRRNLQVGPQGTQETLQGRRLIDRGRTKSVVLFDESATVECSDYVRFEDFAGLVQNLLEALHAIAGIPSVQRLGLRYIDEIQVEGFETSAVGDWGHLISEHLLSPTAGQLGVADYWGAMRLKIHDHHEVGFRYGVLREPVVDPDGPLRIAGSPEGQYFLLDLDSFWTAPEDEFPEFEAGEVMERLVELHAPIRELFESSITEELRLFMRGDNDG